MFIPTPEKKKMKFVKKLYQVPGWENYWVSEDGKVFSTKNEKVKELKPYLMGHDRSKRLAVGLTNGNIRKNFTIHRLIATVFHGPCPDGMECCHNDGDPFNNHRDNLRWDTRKNNEADKKLHGTSTVGSKNGLSKLTEADVLQIRATYAAGGITQKTLAKQYRVSHTVIGDIINRKNWTHI